MAPRFTAHPGRIRFTVFAAGATLASLLTAGNALGSGPSDSRRVTMRDVRNRGPTVVGKMSHYKVNQSLARAFRDALRRIYYNDSCQDLFASLGSDGITVLGNTSYTLASTDGAQQVCDDAEAFTTVGGSTVWLCGTFGWLSDREAAIVLIHEALHSAGLREQPHYPDGPTADEIDQMVERQCGF